VAEVRRFLLAALDAQTEREFDGAWNPGGR
jgi:hypothetical protein